MKSIIMACAILALISLNGCATITRGSTQAWTVNTTPSGATASLSNGERCETPCTLKLKRKHPFALEICKAGYKAVNTNIVSHMSGAGGLGLAGNVIFGGAIGAGIDAGTGATKDLTPNPLEVQLEPSETASCVAPSFPVIPLGGQSTEDYAKSDEAKDNAKSRVVAKTTPVVPSSGDSSQSKPQPATGSGDPAQSKAQSATGVNSDSAPAKAQAEQKAPSPATPAQGG